MTAPLPLHRNPVTKEPTKRSNQHDSQRPSSCYAALSLSRLLQTLLVMPDLTTLSQTLKLRVLIGWGSSFLLGIRASYSKYFHHVTKNYLRLRICQIFYTSKILKFLNFTRGKRVNRDIFGQDLTTENVFFIPFEQIVSVCALMYLDSNSLKLLCENSSLNLANFTNRVIFRMKS